MIIKKYYHFKDIKISYKNNIVIIWDITNNYNIKYQIDIKYENNIYSCLLIFPHNINENYIITSTFHRSNDIDKSTQKYIH